MSTKRRTAGVFASPQPKNAAGEKVCRNCGKVLPRNKRNNCSSKCSKEWALKTSPALMRRAVFARDKGVCAQCGADTQAQQSEYMAKRKEQGTDYNVLMKTLREKFGVFSVFGHWWEADHITPVIEGGGECGLEGYRTLCIPCPRKVTAELRRRMSRRRRDEKALKNDLAGMFADQVEA